MKKSITTVSIILLTLVLSACDSKEKKAFIRGCAEGLADKSICSCAYDKLNDLFYSIKSLIFNIMVVMRNRELPALVFCYGNC